MSAPPAPDPAARAAPRRHVLLAVFAGGAIGTLLRAIASEALPHDVDAWPWATFVVNLVGAFLLGWWATRVVRSPDVDPRARPFLATGICGGLTTFSTLQVELVGMLRADALPLAGGYAAASVVLGLAAVAAGRAAAVATGREGRG